VKHTSSLPGSQGVHIVQYISLPEFPLEWALKDVNLAIDSADDGSLPILTVLSAQWQAAVDAGHGREDISAAVLALGE
jgi:3-hydroxyisobutyrate dehydrogenase